MLLDCVCWTRLLRTRITACSVNIHLLLYQSSTYRSAVAAHRLEFEVSKCRSFQFTRYLLSGQVRTWNDLPYTVCLTSERWMGLEVQSTVRWFDELLFQFFVAQVLVGLRKQLFTNSFVFHNWACAAAFNNNNNKSASWQQHLSGAALLGGCIPNLYGGQPRPPPKMNIILCKTCLFHSFHQ